ncbi:MAG: acyltransferase family protein [Thalassotalea sp.]
MQFRQDINALRAIAIIAVVIFHFRPQWMTGGFAGVDVFFVISGYLMTGIILKKLRNDTFSTWQFYLGRARRIFPALAVLCFGLLIFGWFYLYALDYKELSKHVLNALGFISNVVFARDTGYFVSEATEQWLLHTWSLAVEWQFYLLYPLLLVLLAKCTKLKNLFYLLALTALFSLSYSIYLSANEAEKAFYLLPTRAWEMLIGCLAFLRPIKLSDVAKTYVQLLGLIIILLSYFCLSDSDIWPGYLALIPVVGTYLVIIANQQYSLFSSNKLLSWLGKASYSIYLWHWPIVVFGVSQSILQDNNFLLLGLTLSLIFGYLSFKYIEKANFTFFKRIYLQPRYLYLGVILTSFAIYKSGGAAIELRTINSSDKGQFAYRYERNNYLENIDIQYREQCNFIRIKASEKLDPICMVTGKSGGVFLWGDSHAQALVYGLKQVLPEHVPFNHVTTSSCDVSLEPLEYGNKKRRAACLRSNQYIKDHLSSLKPKVVILAQRQRHDITDFEKIALYLLQQGVEKVILVGQTPQWYPSLPNAILRRHWDNNSSYIEDVSLDTSTIEINQKLNDKYQHSDKLKYISLVDHFCQQNACMMKLKGSNTPIVWDYGHLTNEASLYIAEHLIFTELAPLIDSDNKIF